MREYTTIPNVFRVASLQSVNNQLHHSNNSSNNNNNNNHNNNGHNNNCNGDNNQGNDSHLQQQQQPQQQLNINTTTLPISSGCRTATTTTQAIVHAGTSGSSGAGTSGMLNDAVIGAENVAIRVNYPHKLTTIASIERQQYQQQHPHTHPNVQHQNPHTHVVYPHPHQHLHSHSQTNAHDVVVIDENNRRGMQSPYATLPRGLNVDVQTKPNTSRQQHDEQRIINTISGSIPSTGYTNNIITLDRSGSLGSDLNISLTDFSQLNSLDTQEQHQHQQQQQQQQKYYHHDDYAHFQTSRRLSQKPFMELERKNDNGYLWILTPVAAR